MAIFAGLPEIAEGIRPGLRKMEWQRESGVAIPKGPEGPGQGDAPGIGLFVSATSPAIPCLGEPDLWRRTEPSGRRFRTSCSVRDLG